MIDLLHSLRNTVDYPLRRWIHWRRPGLTLRNEDKENLFSFLPVRDRRKAARGETALRTKYHLDELYRHSRVGYYCENLFYLDMIARALDLAELPLGEQVSAVDIGPSHWFYVHSLYRLLEYWPGREQPRQVTLEAYEADPYRVYIDLYSRMDHALAAMQGLSGAVYHPFPFTHPEPSVQISLMLFPFTFRRDHLAWGLPRSRFSPGDLLRAAWESLSTTGALIIANQGEQEHAEQRRLLEQNQIPISAAFRHESLFFQYDIPRYVLVCRRSETRE